MNQKRRAAANFLLGKFNAEQTQEVFEILGVSTDEARRVIANLKTVTEMIDAPILAPSEVKRAA